MDPIELVYLFNWNCIDVGNLFYILDANFAFITFTSLIVCLLISIQMGKSVSANIILRRVYSMWQRSRVNAVV